MKLTKEQCKAMFQLGDTESEYEIITEEVLAQLMELGLVYQRPSDGHLDFTDLGEKVYDELIMANPDIHDSNKPY